LGRFIPKPLKKDLLKGVILLKMQRMTFKRSFFALYFITHTLLLTVLGNIRAFAPDELSYINCFKGLYSSNFDLAPFGGWWNADIIFLRVLYLPVKIFTFLPFSDLVLLRIYSIILTSLALYLLIHSTKITDSYLGKLALIVFTFTPSVFLWTTLAIKESFILLALVVFFLGIECIHKSKGVVGYIACLFSGYSLLNLKGYLFVILTISIVLAVTIKFARTLKFEKTSLLLLFVLFLPYAMSPSTSALILESSIDFGSKLSEFRVVDEISQTNPSQTNPSQTNPSQTNPSQTNPSQTNPSQTDPSQTDPSQTGRESGTTLSLLNQEASQNTLFNSVMSILHLNDYLSSKALFYSESSSKDLYAKRSLNPANPTDFKGFLNGLLALLIFPNVFRSNGSAVLDLLGFEIFLWIFLYSTAVYIGWKFKSNLVRFNSICLITYSLMFLVVSEMTEINLGTAIRHRIVLGITLIIFIGSQKITAKNTLPK